MADSYHRGDERIVQRYDAMIKELMQPSKDKAKPSLKRIGEVLRKQFDSAQAHLPTLAQLRIIIGANLESKAGEALEIRTSGAPSLEVLSNKASLISKSNKAPETSISSLGRLLPTAPLFPVHKAKGREINTSDTGGDGVLEIEPIDDVLEVDLPAEDDGLPEERNDDVVDKAWEVVAENKANTDDQTRNLVAHVEQRAQFCTELFASVQEKKRKVEELNNELEKVNSELNEEEKSKLGAVESLSGAIEDLKRQKTSNDESASSHHEIHWLDGTKALGSSVISRNMNGIVSLLVEKFPDVMHSAPAGNDVTKFLMHVETKTSLGVPRHRAIFLWSKAVLTALQQTEVPAGVCDAAHVQHLATQLNEYGFDDIPRDAKGIIDFAMENLDLKLEEHIEEHSEEHINFIIAQMTGDQVR